MSEVAKQNVGGLVVSRSKSLGGDVCEESGFLLQEGGKVGYVAGLGTKRDTEAEAFEVTGVDFLFNLTAHRKRDNRFSKLDGLANGGVAAVGEKEPAGCKVVQELVAVVSAWYDLSAGGDGMPVHTLFARQRIENLVQPFE